MYFSFVFNEEESNEIEYNEINYWENASLPIKDVPI